MIHKTLLFCSLTSALAAGQSPVTVDLDAGSTEQVKLANGTTASVTLLSASETRDKIRNAVRSAIVEVEINGARSALTCGNYRLPIAIGGVQADCAVTRAYYDNSSADHWRLKKLARLRLWPKDSPFLDPGSMVYPVRQRWFATPTQMANEPTYVDGGEGFEQRRVYYHSGLNIGGAEGLTEVVSATDGVAVGVGRAILEDGYAAIKHAFAKPGDYLVSVERANTRGEKAIGRLWVRVEAEH